MDPSQELQELKDKITLMKDDYQRRINSSREMIEDLQMENPQTSATLSAIYRLNTKRSEYKAIMRELNKLT